MADTAVEIRKERGGRRYRHGSKTKDGKYVGVHVTIAEKVLGCKLPTGAEVHHADNNGRNNANSNLVICENRSYHKLLHVRLRVHLAGGNPDTDKICSKCKNPKNKSEFGRSANRSDGTASLCKVCASGVQADIRKAKRHGKSSE